MIRYIILGIDIILLIAFLFLSIQVIFYLKKNEGKKVKELDNYLKPRIKILKVLTIILVILGIFVVIYNAIK